MEDPSLDQLYHTLGLEENRVLKANPRLRAEVYDLVREFRDLFTSLECDATEMDLVEYPLEAGRKPEQAQQRARVVPPWGGAAYVEPIDLWGRDGDADSLGEEEDSESSDEDRDDRPLIFSILDDGAASCNIPIEFRMKPQFHSPADIMVITDEPASHVPALRGSFQEHRQACIRIQATHIKLFRTESTYLGHQVDQP